MLLLILGLAMFFAVHLLPSFPGPYDRLKGRLGEAPFTAVYALISLAGLVLAGFGKARAEVIPIWAPTELTMSIAPGLMLPAFVLLALAYVQSNVNRFLRHPMLTAVLLWAAAHLLANGDLASIVLFGSFAVYSVFAMISANRRGAKKATEYYSVLGDLIGAGVGVALYALFVYLHPVLFGVPALLPEAN